MRWDMRGKRIFVWDAIGQREREFFIDNLLVRIHFIIVMIRWTGLAPWEFEFPVPGSLISTFLSVRSCPSSCSGAMYAAVFRTHP